MREISCELELPTADVRERARRCVELYVIASRRAFVLASAKAKSVGVRSVARVSQVVGFALRVVVR